MVEEEESLWSDKTDEGLERLCSEFNPGKNPKLEHIKFTYSLIRERNLLPDVSNMHIVFDEEERVVLFNCQNLFQKDVL